MSAYIQLGTAFSATTVFLFILFTSAKKYCRRPHVPLWASALTLLVLILSTFTRIQLIPFNADEFRRDFLLTGDEPAYLMTALSIAHDGDLNLTNNGANKEWIKLLRLSPLLALPSLSCILIELRHNKTSRFC